MSGTQRPSFTELVDWVEGRLPSQRGARVSAQVDGDAQLQDAVEWIRRFLATAAQAPLTQPPDQLRAALRAVFREQSGRRDGMRGAARLVLLFDSRRDHTLSGVRGVDADMGIQLAYTGDAADLVLDVCHVSDTAARVDGQLFLRDEQPASTEVAVRAADGRLTHASGLDPLGRFTAGEVPVGPIEVRVRAGDVDVVAECDLTRTPDQS